MGMTTRDLLNEPPIPSLYSSRSLRRVECEFATACADADAAAARTPRIKCHGSSLLGT